MNAKNVQRETVKQILAEIKAELAAMQAALMLVKEELEALHVK